MARPMKDYKFKQNGKSLQVYERGVYLGCISIRKLCQLLTKKENNGTGDVSAQPDFISGSQF